MSDQEELRGDIINHSEESQYVVPREEAVREKLEWFRDQKLALMVHWGPYSEMGIAESWPLSDEDADWAREGLQWEEDKELFRQQYTDLNKSFNPLRFHPETWASFAKDVGFKYFIFTTKHHDGFCMYDSKYTTYKVTDPSCPYHTNKRADIARLLFDAFRKEGIAIAPYFSKPDWHCPWYWAEGQELPVGYWRNPTYVPAEKPEIWEKFIEYTHNQLTELAEDMGPVDILWLDGGQVTPKTGQDIRLMELVNKLRRKNPGLIVADRTVGGETENYITPEQQVPNHYISVPWESCVTIAKSFSYHYDEDLKSLRQLVHLLVDIVGKGGNLALNLGAQADGRLPDKACQRARELGDWLKVNGEAIFCTRALEPYFAGDWSFTQNKENRFAIYRVPENETLPARMTLPLPGIKEVQLLGEEKPLPVLPLDGCAIVTLPKHLHGQSPCALSFKLNK